MRGVLLAAAILAGAGCGGVPGGRGLAAEMTVAGAQFTAGAMPAAGGGPAVVALDLQSNAAHAGEIEESARRRARPDGDRGRRRPRR